ncbi:CidA/LrgA family protein [Halalkalibacter nanhaiisediminis]|uniref:Holin-like protein n=1 Tax=Halalkalibacter nanhaiisediminis TaxID=688079 RepID=A0A562QJI4_9BACI|nr:CidA/LrgA family holin-like protein [Halalkalibacter nanhaiisediminis]TWI56912.1 holin-like protein [Halalkalibacter nanhaiisediminis]
MKWIIIIIHILVLSIFYMIGEWIQETFHLFIPGSIIGMLLLFTLLVTKVLPVRFIEQGTHLILQHMPILFLPVTVGTIQFLDLFAGKGILLIVIALMSTIMVFLTSGWMAQILANRKEGEKL